LPKGSHHRAFQRHGHYIRI